MAVQVCVTTGTEETVLTPVTLHQQHIQVVSLQLVAILHMRQVVMEAGLTTEEHLQRPMTAEQTAELLVARTMQVMVQTAIEVVQTELRHKEDTLAHSTGP